MIYNQLKTQNNLSNTIYEGQYNKSGQKHGYGILEWVNGPLKGQKYTGYFE